MNGLRPRLFITTTMTIDERFADQVEQMRYWQKIYFRSRSEEAKQNAIALEKKVDKMIEDRKIPSLFNNQ